MLDLLTRHFNLEELRSLCFDLRIQPDELGGQGLRSVARELLQYMQRRGRLPELLAALHVERPSVAWPTADELASTLAPTAGETPTAHSQIGRDNIHIEGGMNNSAGAFGQGASVVIGKLPKPKKRKDGNR